jgi:D-lactate dehydrogenase
MTHDSRITSLIQALSGYLPAKNIQTDLTARLAKGTDAGFYRLVPALVIRADTEESVRMVIMQCSALGIPLTFKAGGTSLSGQTITDSVLVEIGPLYNKWSVQDHGQRVTLQCGITGGLVNQRLSRYNRRIGPDPASISAAKIGGIVSNNASGGAFGILHNSYHTLESMRVILADGTLLDTGDPESRTAFSESHGRLLDSLSDLSRNVNQHPEMANRIRHKYEIKNTCGYSLNALIDFEDPFDILSHLMVGAEGTLGFISGVTLRTVEEYPLKATSLVFFPTLRAACEVVPMLEGMRITAAELMDRNALRSVQDRPGMPESLKELGAEVTALLIDTAASTRPELDEQIRVICARLSGVETIFPIEFTADPLQYESIWKVRKGLFTSAAAIRPSGTACIIEDLAFRLKVLPDALVKLRALTEQYGYEHTVIWGHILDGNIHFVITPDFNKAEGIENYHHFMTELVHLTVNVCDGSLKGEHGTGRNMAPFVRAEWGDDLYAVMHEIKNLFDPQKILNPGVILNEDDRVHLKNIKTYPVTGTPADPCIECGFCEPACPSRELTLTPRQRIVVLREMHRLHDNGEYHDLKSLRKAFEYQGDATCATDGLCALNCPVEIDTGKVIKQLRYETHSRFANRIAGLIARNMRPATTGIRLLLNANHLVHRISLGLIPLWNAQLPQGAPPVSRNLKSARDKVVYFPSCINRTMGKSTDYGQQPALVEKTIALLEKAGFEVIFPANLEKLCCGMAFSSKGFKRQAAIKATELEHALLTASRHGEYPVYCDMSPCLLTMRETLDHRLKLFDPVGFITTFFPSRVTFTPVNRVVTVHSTCSNTKSGQKKSLESLARMCAAVVVVPDEVNCCGWAGDRGFLHPELNAAALRPLKSQLHNAVHEGYSTSRTCEIGLSLHSGISYKSIVYLVDEATEAIPR